jgi:hypothetical protein
MRSWPVLIPMRCAASGERGRGREASIWGIEGGLGEVSARLFATDAAALDARLDALADAVCEADPRTRDERRADALGALAAGAERLGCQCATPQCGAGSARVKQVVIHVVAEQSSLTNAGATTKPAKPPKPAQPQHNPAHPTTGPTTNHHPSSVHGGRKNFAWGRR